MKNPSTDKPKTKIEIIQSMLARVIENSRMVGDSLSDIEESCCFVAAAFYYRDFEFEVVAERAKNDVRIHAVVAEAKYRAGLWGSK